MGEYGCNHALLEIKINDSSSLIRMHICLFKMPEKAIKVYLVA